MPRPITKSRTEKIAETLEPPRTWGYVRVSRADLSKEVFDADDAMEQVQRSILSQGDEIRKHFAAKCFGLPPIREIVADSGITSDQPLKNRPNGKRLCAELRKGDHIIIAKWDRAFRDTAEGLTMLKEWKAGGVNLHIINFNDQPAELTSQSGLIMVSIMSMVSELEKMAIKDRFRLGRLFAERNNLPVGTHDFGILWHDGAWRKTWEIEMIEFYAQMRDRGYTGAEATKHMMTRWVVYRPFSVIGQRRIYTAFEVLAHYGNREAAMEEARKNPGSKVMAGFPKIRGKNCPGCLGTGRGKHNGQTVKCGPCEGWGRVVEAIGHGRFEDHYHIERRTPNRAWRRHLKANEEAKRPLPQRDIPCPYKDGPLVFDKRKSHALSVDFS